MKRSVNQFNKRVTHPFQTQRQIKRYWWVLTILCILSVCSIAGLLLYHNPVPIDSPSFMPVVKRRMTAVIAMGIAAVCQSLATVSFQSITNNKVITPSLLGFEALYATIQTSMLFFFGAQVFINFSGLDAFLFQVVAMVVMCLILYGWLLSGKYGDMQLMLLVGIIMGTGLRSLSSFMRRLLAPSEFDILQARLFGSVNNANASYFPIAIPVVIGCGVLLMLYAKKLNIASLGKDIATSIGLNHQRSSIYVLILVAVLMSISTALIGSLTFYGFLVATLSYQLAPTYDHRYMFPMALAVGFLVITGAYFFMYHIFNAQGVVTIIIEMFGGITFLLMILRKGSV